MPESLFFSLALKLEVCLKSGSSAVSLLISQDTCRLAGLELKLDRSASVSVRPYRGEQLGKLWIENVLFETTKAHWFAVWQGGEAGLEGALPPKLAADVGALAGYCGAPCGNEAAAGWAQVLRMDAKEYAQTGDVLSQRHPEVRDQSRKHEDKQITPSQKLKQEWSKSCKLDSSHHGPSYSSFHVECLTSVAHSYQYIKDKNIKILLNK